MRTATHGRSVWGLNLDETAPVTETYLRAHPGDTRRVFPADGKDPTAARAEWRRARLAPTDAS
jgi:hypothetical protein